MDGAEGAADIRLVAQEHEMSHRLSLCLITASAVTLMIVGFAMGSELWASMSPDRRGPGLDDFLIDS